VTILEGFVDSALETGLVRKLEDKVEMDYHSPPRRSRRCSGAGVERQAQYRRRGQARRVQMDARASQLLVSFMQS
jgi:hypothetical protein